MVWDYREKIESEDPTDDRTHDLIKLCYELRLRSREQNLKSTPRYHIVRRGGLVDIWNLSGKSIILYVLLIQEILIK